MTHISDLHDYDGEPHEAVVQDFLSQGRKEQIKSVLEEMIIDEFDRLEEYGGEHISQLAAHRAEKFLERVLRGEDDAAMALLGSKNDSGRYRQSGYDEGKPWASVIHGKVFETSGMALRRQIVEANSELLVSERIKDLESIVEGLRQQVVQLEAQLERRYAE